MGGEYLDIVKNVSDFMIYALYHNCEYPIGNIDNARSCKILIF